MLGRLGVWIVVAIHLAVALPLARTLNIWADEASSLYTTQNGLFSAWINVIADEKQAPLYFLVLSLWRELDSTFFFARSLSMIFSVAAIIVFWRIALRFWSRPVALLATAFFGLHPFLIWASLEIRVYSMVVFLSVSLIAVFMRLFYDDENGRISPTIAALYVLTAVVAVDSNYYLGFMLVANFAALVAHRKWKHAVIYLGLMVLVGIAILPNLWTINTQISSATRDFVDPRTLGEGLRMIWNSVVTMLLPTEIFPPEEITSVSFARLWIVRAGIVLTGVGLAIRFRNVSSWTFAFGSMSAVVAAFLLASYFILGAIYVEIRHAAVIFPPLVLFAMKAAEDLFCGIRENTTIKWALLSSAALVIACFFAYSMLTLYPEGAKRGDWMRVSRYIEETEKPGQPIVVFTAFDALNVPHHYTGRNKVFPDERFFNWGLRGDAASAESQLHEIEFIISEIPADAAEIWLLTSDRCQNTNACEPLEIFVAENYTVIDDKLFYKQRVRLLRKISR